MKNSAYKPTMGFLMMSLIVFSGYQACQKFQNESPTTSQLASNGISTKLSGSSPGWTAVQGQLSQMSLGAAGSPWGINQQGNNYLFSQTINNWINYPGLFSEIAVGNDDQIWALDRNGKPFRFNFQMGGWQSLPGVLSQIAVGADGTTWGVNAQGNTYYYSASAQNWVNVPGLLSHIAVGNVNAVWGINSNGDAFHFNPASGNWENAPGVLLSQLAVGIDGTVWGLTTAGQPYYFNPSNNAWVSVPGVLTHIAVGNANEVWGTNSWKDVYQLNGTNWNYIPGASLTNIYVSGNGDVWGLDGMNIYRYVRPTEIAFTPMPILTGNLLFSQAYSNFTTQYTFPESYAGHLKANTGSMFFGNNFNNACNPNGRLPLSVPVPPLGLPQPYTSTGQVDSYFGSIDKVNKTFPFGSFGTPDGGAGFNLNTADPNVPIDATCNIWGADSGIMDQIVGTYPEFFPRPQLSVFSGGYNGIQVSFKMMIPYLATHQVKSISPYGNIYFNFINYSTGQSFQIAAGAISVNAAPGSHPVNIGSSTVNQDISFATTRYLTPLAGSSNIVTGPTQNMQTYGYTFSEQQLVNTINAINSTFHTSLSTNISQYVFDSMWFDIEVFRQNYTSTNPLLNDAVMMTVFLKDFTISQVQLATATNIAQYNINIVPSSSGGGSCLDLAQGNAGNHALVQQSACSKKLEQSWKLNSVGNSEFQIVSNLSGLCMDIINGNLAPGALIQDYQCTPGDGAQLWKFAQVGVNRYQIVSALSGLCMEVANGSPANSAQIQQNTCGALGQTNQTFNFVGSLN